MLKSRSQEIKYLNTYYGRDGSQIIVMYGAAGIGKRAIIRDFLADKPHYFYCARPGSEREQLYQWGNELALFGHKLPKYPAFDDIFAALINEKGLKTVLVIDDFQYIIKNSPTFIKKLVETVHGHWKKSPVLIILLSSQIGFIENSLVAKIGEQAYELSGFLKIKELNFFELSDFFCSSKPFENIEAYAVLGGNPGLWQYFRKGLTTKENIIANILTPQAFLHRHGERTVAGELREMGIYNTILAAVAGGHKKLNDLYRHTGFSRAKIIVYLKNLQELELVEKVFSLNSSKTYYRIANHLVHFHFTYLYPHLSDLGRLPAEEFYETHIAPTFKSYVAGYFKIVCMAKLAQLNRAGELPLKIDKSGEWTGKEGTFAGKEGTFAGKEGTFAGKEGAIAGKEGAIAGKEGAFANKDGILTGKEGAFAGKNSAITGNDGMFTGKEGAFADKEGAFADKDGAFADKDGTFTGKDGTGKDGTGKDGTFTGKDRTFAGKGGAFTGGNEAFVAKDGSLDIIARDAEGKTLLGFCNWEKPLMTYDDYEWLLFCADKAGINPDFIYLFSGGSFDEKLNLEAKVKQNIRLIGVDEL